MKPLRLLAIIEAQTITGPAKNLLEFARLARAAGVETTLTTFTRGEQSNLFTETARKHSIPVQTIPESGPYDRTVIRALAETVSRLQPHVLQTHAVKSHFLARLAGLPKHAPWIAFHHGYTFTSWRTRLYNELDHWSLPAAKKVLTVSDPFRRQLQAKGVRQGRIEIVHNAIRPDWAEEAKKTENAAALRALLEIPPDRQVILIVGRLSLEKDHLTLLDAVHGLRPRFTPHLLIVGEGPERPRIEERIRLLGMTGQVTLTGQRNSAEPYYGMADLAVLSSWTEGSPNALLEAMAAGVPVVATAVGGVPEIVTHQDSALLVNPGDAAGMAAALRQLLEDPEMGSRQALRARELVRQHYTPEERTRRLVGIYREIASSH